MFIFDITLKQFIYIIRTQNSYIGRNPRFFTDRKISVFDDESFIWDKFMNKMILNINNISNPICLSFKFPRSSKYIGKFILNRCQGDEYLINFRYKHYFSRKQNNIFVPDFMIINDNDLDSFA